MTKKNPSFEELEKTVESHEEYIRLQIEGMILNLLKDNNLSLIELASKWGIPVEEVCDLILGDDDTSTIIHTLAKVCYLVGATVTLEAFTKDKGNK